VYAKLLDQGVYLASVPTMYRVLRAHGEVHERRRQATHLAAKKPELIATKPNQVYSWDITKLLGPAKWTPHRGRRSRSPSCWPLTRRWPRRWPPCEIGSTIDGLCRRRSACSPAERSRPDGRALQRASRDFRGIVAGLPQRRIEHTASDLAIAGGRDRRRSGDLPLFRRTLCQLSYPTAWVFTSPGEVAVPTGFEPAASGLTGRRALQTAPRDRDLAAAPPTGFEPVLPP
jgi:hypothetical protein